MALMTKQIKNMEETRTLVYKLHEDCGVWAKNQTWTVQNMRLCSSFSK